MVYSGPWRPVNSLPVLRGQINAAAPNRSKASDGMLADDLHSTTSDHYPQRYPALGVTPVVCAFDGTHDPGDGCDCAIITEAIRVSRDARVKYVIWNRRMYSSYRSGDYAPFTWRPYTGSNDPHTNHFHISVLPTAAADDTRPWAIGVSDVATIDEIKAAVDRIEQAGLAPTNAAVYWWRLVLEGRQSPLFNAGSPYATWTKRDGIPELLAAIAELPTGLAQQIAIELAANPAFVSGIADLVAASVGAKIGGVVQDTINGSEVTSTIHTATE
jgi:hypothetical protein